MEDSTGVSSLYRKVQSIEGKLNYFLKHLNKLNNSINFSTFKKDTSGIEYAKFCSTMAFILCSLRHIQLKLEGINVTIHPISTYLNRIKCYMKQINDLQIKENEKRPRVNKSAARRLINAATS